MRLAILLTLTGISPVLGDRAVPFRMISLQALPDSLGRLLCRKKIEKMSFDKIGATLAKMEDCLFRSFTLVNLLAESYCGGTLHSRGNMPPSKVTLPEEGSKVEAMVEWRVFLENRRGRSWRSRMVWVRPEDRRSE
jgi:hypothetical protein